jgi:hypothetical protein
VYQKNSGNSRRNKDKGNKLRNKILIIGDSHTRGFATNLRHNLDDDYNVLGIVKPGSDLTSILSSDILTKNNVVIVWGRHQRY